MNQSFKLDLFIKQLCVLAILWVNLGPSLHEVSHLIQGASNHQCHHHNDKTPCKDESPKTEFQQRDDECKLCLSIAQLPSLWNFEGYLEALIISSLSSINDDCEVVRFKQDCKIAYQARAGPRVI